MTALAVYHYDVVQEVCYQYWPSEVGGGEEEVTHGEFTITAGSVKYDTITQRTLTLVHHSQVRNNIPRTSHFKGMADQQK